MRPDLYCENKYCMNRVGHLQNECFAYGGGKCGVYLEWWKGPRDLYLPPKGEAPLTVNQMLMN
jgi:hypothetical protein